MRAHLSHTRLLCRLLSCTLAATLLALPLRRAEAFAALPFVKGKAAAGIRSRAVRADAPRRAGEVLVRFSADLPEQGRDDIARGRGVRRKEKLRGESRIERMEVSDGRDPAAVAEELRREPGIELAEPNFLISRAQVEPNDPRFPEQWALVNEGQSGGAAGSDISAAGAWRTTTGASTTVVAVIDSGIDFTHPDLRDDRWENGKERENARDDDRNGYTNDLHGWDWVAGGDAASDGHGHGTAVAGIIAARGDNGVGVSGVMWRASLMSLRVLDSAGTGDVADAVEAIDYAAAEGAQVINCSWGTEAESLALRDAIERAGRRGAVVVASAGNGARDLDPAPYFPASFDLPNLISVAASDQFDNLAPFSNWGAAGVSVAAPGTDILTTKAGGDYRMVSGTSVSAPLVSGVVGLVKTQRPWLSSADAKRAVLDGARRVGTLAGKVSSGGVASAEGALASLRGPYDTPGGGGNGRGGQTPTPPDAGRGRNDYRGAPPPAPFAAAPQGGPNLDALRNQPSYLRENPPAPIRADSQPLCDCHESPGGSDPEFSNARGNLKNETGGEGEDLGSRNFNWGVPLVSLPGRAGLDLNLSLTYNSLVWTRDQNAMMFNADYGFPSPGFRLGFPHVQKLFTDSEVFNHAYMLVTPSGGRVKLRRVGTTSTFEATDGSYTQLIDYGAGGAVVRTTDGTQYAFENTPNGEKRCREIKDRNGNYITVAYDGAGRVQSVTDTLGRVVGFVYDSDGNLFQLTQSRGASGHTDLLAQFGYGTQLLQPSFNAEIVNVFSPVGQYVTVLTQVWFPSGVTYNFDYTVWGQVYKIRKHAPDGHMLSYVGYNLPGSQWAATSAQSDCPRFTERRDWIEYGVMQASAETVTTYASAPDNSWSQVRTPDGMVYKEYFHTSGWESGLAYQTEVFHEGTPSVVKKKTAVLWTHDFAGQPSQPYARNARPYETNVYDEGNTNRRRMTFDYTEGYGLPTHVREWSGADGQTFLRLTATAYQLGAAYADRRIIGLPYERTVYDGPTGSVVSREIYHYDWAGSDGWGDAYLSSQAPSTQHDSANYTQVFTVGRGNLSAVLRFNCSTNASAYDGSQAMWVSLSGYDRAGSLIWTKDGLGHRTSLSYTDSFSDAGKNTLNTLAYPTAVTDPEGYQSTTKYNYATGAVVETRRPSSGTSAQGNVTYETHSYLYDWLARLQKVTNLNSGFYTRWEHTDDGRALKSFRNVRPDLSENYSVEVYDGAGRVRRTATFMPGSTTTYGGRMVYYDSMGRAAQWTNPTEMLGDWAATGPDASVGWVSTSQTYDWQGRPLVTVLPKLTDDPSEPTVTRENTYGGCGCAGGDVVTARDERGRRRRLYKDSLGRLAKVEEVNYDGSVYSTAVYAYNSRDQLTSIRHYQGTEAGGVYQQRTLAYDGHGRLSTRTTPEQGTTTYTYNADDTPNTTTDARGATNTYGYTARHLVSSITFGVPSGVAATPNVSFAYDAAGNRTSMTDGQGSAAYAYDSLSRMTQESRTFNGLGTFSLSYTYNNAGLASLTNPSQLGGSQVSYAVDHTGALQSVTGSGGVTYSQSLQYRASGGIKSEAYGNGRSLSVTYDRRLRADEWSVSNVMGWKYSYTEFGENTGRVTYAQHLHGATAGLPDPTLDRSYDYDLVGRLHASYTGTEARWHARGGQQTTQDGPYAQALAKDVWGNITQKTGRTGPQFTASYTNNRRVGFTYDAAGNLTNDLGQTFTYDATGQQATASYGGYSLTQSYDGDRLRIKKSENGVAAYYLRSSVLGGQVVAEVNSSGRLQRGYVYGGTGLLAMRSGGGAVTWAHQDPVTKSQRLTDSGGSVTAAIDLDPWGVETPRGWNSQQQPRKYTTYERDGNQSDEAMMRRYNRWQQRFDQPDPYGGSYDLADPQSLNRYSYVRGDPVNFTDPSGLEGIQDFKLGSLGSGRMMPGRCYAVMVDGAYVGSTCGGPWMLSDMGVQSTLPTHEDVRNLKPSPEQQRCSDYLAKLFGGKGAVAGANGFTPSGAYRGTYTYNGKTIAGHLSDHAIHISGSKDQTQDTEVFVPSGGEHTLSTTDRDGNTIDLFYYSNLNGNKYTVAVLHLDRSPHKDDRGRLRIGRTGGPGGNGPNDRHVHIELLKGRWDTFPRPSVRGRSRINLSVLCP